MSKKKPNLSSLQREQHNKEVNTLIDETTIKGKSANNHLFLHFFRWIDYILLFVVSGIAIGSAFLISYVFMNNPNRTVWFLLGIGLGLLLLAIILGFIRNQNAVRYFNDKRMRYRKTFSDGELTLRRCAWISFISSVVVLIVSLIVFFTI